MTFIRVRLAVLCILAAIVSAAAAYVATFYIGNTIAAIAVGASCGIGAVMVTEAVAALADRRL